MRNITLICTVHNEHGICNSDSLSDIISRIKPDVIFQEISYSLYTEKYYEQSKKILEIQAINKYIRNKSTLLVDVDKIEMSKSQIDIYNRVITNTIKIYPWVKEFIEYQYNLESIIGFKVLNSKESNLFIKKIEQSITATKNENILSNYKLWKNHIEKRELNMIKNVYEYSKNNEYKKAVFLIGSGHRDSIIKLIQEYKKNSPIKISWRFNSYKNII